MLEITRTQMYRAKIKDDRKVIGDIIGDQNGFMIFSRIPERSYDLLICNEPTLQEAMGKFNEWFGQPISAS